MSPFTFIASASSVLACGAVPKFIDIDETMNIDVNKIEAAISKNTKAIMAIHMQGSPCDMISIKRIAKKHNLKVIEDVAQAFGSGIDDKKSGTFGDCGAFSLQAGKTITCGEGGFIATDNKEIFELAKMYHDNGGYRVGDAYPTRENTHTIYGENFKLTELQSAVAVEQLKKVHKIIEHQDKIYDYILNRIDTDFYKLRPVLEKHKVVHVSLGIQFENEKKCNDFIKYMDDAGIGFNNYCSNLLTEFDTFKYRKSWNKVGYPYNVSKYENTDVSNAKNLFKRTAWFNLSASLKKKHLDYIIEKMREWENEN